MASEEPIKVDETVTAVAEPTPPPPVEENADQSQPLVVSHMRVSLLDESLKQLEKEKKLSFVQAWEEREKKKAENKAERKLRVVGSWESSKKASIEAKLRKRVQALEKKKARCAEKMKNEIALIHKQAEEKRAVVAARRGKEFLEAEEKAANHRQNGSVARKLLLCFGSFRSKKRTSFSFRRL